MKPLPQLPPPPEPTLGPGSPGAKPVGFVPKPPPMRGAARAAIGKSVNFHHKQEKALDMLMSDATDIALGGGARSGKTFLLVYCVLLRAIRCAVSRHAIFRYRLNALLASIVYDTLPKVANLFWPGLWDLCHFDKQRSVFELPNGSSIWFGGLDDKERTEKILGMEFVTIYFNESSQIPYGSMIMALTRLAQVVPDLKQRAYYDFNPPSKRHWTFKLFIEKVQPDNSRLSLPNPNDYAFMYMNPHDNATNLDPKFIARLEAMPPRARKRFLLGQFADESEGTLWDETILDTVRVPIGYEVPDFVRVVIAVDPSGCTGPQDTRSDEIGIVVAALSVDGYAYVLEDLSGKMGPAKWSAVVSDAWERHSADVIVGEANFGGAMVEATITALGNKNLNVKLVFASRGKVVRAEPISALYNGRDGTKVRHYGVFPEMEQQMCDFTTSGYEGDKSPDRADALVFALTELFPGIVKPRDNSNNRNRAPLPVKYAPRASTTHRRR